MKIVVSVIKADIGSIGGHIKPSQKLKETVSNYIYEHGIKTKDVIDYRISSTGDDIAILMTHKKGTLDEKIHKLAWDAFVAGTKVAKEQGLYGAGQDLLKDAFSGNVKGMGPGVAEMEFNEREGEPVLIFMADKTSAGAWNKPLYKMFADPFNTIGLVIAENMHNGFSFEIHDVKKGKKVALNAPEEIYDMLVFMGAPSRYEVKAVRHRDTGEIASVSSTQRLAHIAGRYVGKRMTRCAL